MRLHKLGPALLAAASLLAVAPAGASAHKHPSPLGRCRVNIQLMPASISAGETAEISGQLSCGRRVNPAGQTVQLYAHVAGAAGFVPVGSTATQTGGAYSLTSPAETANTSFYVRSAGAQSASKRLRVALQVTLNPLTSVAEGGVIETGAPNRETFTGTVSPSAADIGARVILQREDAATGEEWHRIGAGSLEAGGTFSIPHIFRVPGDASIRVLVRSDGLNYPSPSNELEYEISQAQNPNLTIAKLGRPDRLLTAGHDLGRPRGRHDAAAGDSARTDRPPAGVRPDRRSQHRNGRRLQLPGADPGQQHALPGDRRRPGVLARSRRRGRAARPG